MPLVARLECFHPCENLLEETIAPTSTNLCEVQDIYKMKLYSRIEMYETRVSIPGLFIGGNVPYWEMVEKYLPSLSALL